jgi:hypothetical protein
MPEIFYYNKANEDMEKSRPNFINDNVTSIKPKFNLKVLQFVEKDTNFGNKNCFERIGNNFRIRESSEIKLYAGAELMHKMSNFELEQFKEQKFLFVLPEISRNINPILKTIFQII